ncbi:MAG: hypothetical protein K2N54_08650 [Helicobacter sp.]|nr:hypothetical protein [Helicobacter sp.]
MAFKCVEILLGIRRSLIATLALLARNDNGILFKNPTICHCEGLPEAINRVGLPRIVDCRARVARSQ